MRQTLSLLLLVALVAPSIAPGPPPLPPPKGTGKGTGGQTTCAKAGDKDCAMPPKEERKRSKGYGAPGGGPPRGGSGPPEFDGGDTEVWTTTFYLTSETRLVPLSTAVE